MRRQEEIYLNYAFARLGDVRPVTVLCDTGMFVLAATGEKSPHPNSANSRYLKGGRFQGAAPISAVRCANREQ